MSASPSGLREAWASPTSLRYLGKGKARAPLEIDVVRVHERAQSPQRFAREEVHLLPLRKESAHVHITVPKGAGGSGRRTFSRYCRRSATASRSMSARTGSYRPSRDRPTTQRISEPRSRQRRLCHIISYLRSMSSYRHPWRMQLRCRRRQTTPTVAAPTWDGSSASRRGAGRDVCRGCFGSCSPADGLLSPADGMIRGGRLASSERMAARVD